MSGQIGGQHSDREVGHQRLEVHAAPGEAMERQDRMLGITELMNLHPATLQISAARIATKTP